MYLRIYIYIHCFGSTCQNPLKTGKIHLRTLQAHLKRMMMTMMFFYMACWKMSIYR